MVRRIEATDGIDSAWIVRQVLRRIPAVFRYIQTADESDGVIDNDNLLVVRCAQRMAAIEAEMNPSVRLPWVTVERNDFTIRGIDHGKVPQQHVDAQLAIAPHQIM
jgi:hypothetical protein